MTPPTSMHVPPRTVLTLVAGDTPRSEHERTSQAWAARQLARLLGWEDGGGHDPSRPPSAPAYFVPDETLTVAQAQRLGIEGEADLFGGVVPHAFVATKVITHPLLSSDSPAPAGWSHAMAAQLGDAVLPGFTVFDPAQVAPAVKRLLDTGGAGARVRLKQALARGGNGQAVVAGMDALPAALATLDMDTVPHHGLVVELNLEQATTVSVGTVRIGGHRIAYLGTQHQVADREGVEVYAGSSLHMVRGGLQALEALAGDGPEQAALCHARRYDAAVEAAYPGFFASRRNYDVVCGLDAGGQRRCGVLEQSWRLGGASPAEIVALSALAAGAAGPLRVSCHESHDPAHAPPAHAHVHFHQPLARRGPVIKYAVVEPAA